MMPKKPRQGETREDFIQRCMASSEMNSEFSDADQRFAVCNSYWRDRNKAMADEIEHKNTILDVKFAEGESWSFEGYGAVYGNVDDGNDILVKGAFDTSLASGRRVKMLWQHDPTQPIGVWETINSDERGLRVKGRLLKDVEKGREAYALLKEGVIDGLSIGYKTKDAERSGGNRLIKAAELWEISLVTFPMNTDAMVSQVKQLQSIRDVERILRDAGVPNEFAKLVASHGYDEAKTRLNDGQREADDEKDRERMDALMKKLKGLKEAFHA